jgi:cytochrome c553
MINKNKFLTIVAITFSLSNAAIASDEIHGGDPEAGKALAADCGACHGNDGNSATPMFPKLAGLGEKYMVKQLRDMVAKKRNVPQMIGPLEGKSDKDLQDLAAYFNSQTMQLSGAKEAKVLTNSGIKVDSLALGARIYRAGNSEVGTPACSGCHSPRGLGNDAAGFPRLGGQHAKYIAAQLRNFRAGKRTNDGDSKIMRSVAEHMSDAEIKAVANYIAGLN